MNFLSAKQTSTHWAQCEAKDLRLPQADSEYSDQTGRMPMLILVYWTHRLFCWFCHALDHIYISKPLSNKPRHEKSYLRSTMVKPGKSQTRLLGHRGQQDSWNFRNSDYIYYAI